MSILLLFPIVYMPFVIIQLWESRLHFVNTVSEMAPRPCDQLLDAFPGFYLSLHFCCKASQRSNVSYFLGRGIPVTLLIENNFL